MFVCVLFFMTTKVIVWLETVIDGALELKFKDRVERIGTPPGMVRVWKLYAASC